jgi:enoyl-CoA hydratase/carnithine racemase
VARQGNGHGQSSLHVKVELGGQPLDGKTSIGLVAALEGLAEDSALRAIVLSGSNWTFAPDVEARPLVEACAALPQPVVAAIDGPAHEEGLELALACDIRIASSRATFRMGQVGEGRIPLAGGTQRLPRLVGAAVANRLVLLGQEIDADEAVVCGLVSELQDDPEQRAVQVAATIAKRGPLAERYAKEAMNRGMEMPLEQALRYETDLTIILQSTADRGEGVRAFLEKREPRFRGS